MSKQHGFNVVWNIILVFVYPFEMGRANTYTEPKFIKIFDLFAKKINFVMGRRQMGLFPCEL